MFKYSKCKKLENTLKAIEEQLQDLGIEEIKHYYNEFKNKGLSDFNIVQYGNLLIYYDEVREFYNLMGYKTIEKFSNDKIWETYKRQVGFVARNMLREEGLL